MAKDGNIMFCLRHATSGEADVLSMDSQLGKQGASLGGMLAATEGTKDGPVVPAPASTLAGGFSERCERTNAAIWYSCIKPKKESNRRR